LPQFCRVAAKSQQTFKKLSIKFVVTFDANICFKFAALRQSCGKWFLKFASILPQVLPRLCRQVTVNFDGSFATNVDTSVAENFFKVFAATVTTLLLPNLTETLRRMLPLIFRSHRRKYFREISHPI
jgi:hypothetical protein